MLKHKKEWLTSVLIFNFFGRFSQIWFDDTQSDDSFIVDNSFVKDFQKLKFEKFSFLG